MARPDYSELVVDHFSHPRNAGALPNATGRGSAGDESGGQIRVEISVRVENGVIAESRFRAFGCSATIAAASATTELLTNRTPQSALSISPLEVESALDGLPEDRKYCAEYAASAARKAVEAHLYRTRE